MRERLPTLDLDDTDIVGITAAPVAPAPAARRTSAPPPPLVSTTPPPSVSTTPPLPVSTTPPPSVSTTPPPPVSTVRLSGSESEAAPSAVAPPAPVPAVDEARTEAPRLRLASDEDIDTGWEAPPAARPASAEPVLRLSINDPTDLLFEGVYGLTFARSKREAADMCAETLARALGARAVIVHSHDLTSRELRAIGAHGDGDFEIIGSAEASDDDLVASAVICNERSVTMTFDGELPRIAPKRLHAVGAPRTVVAAPAMAWGRCLAIVEVIDADERYAARVADSTAYVAEQLARFLSAHAA